MKNSFLILFSIALITISSFSFAETSRIIYVDQNGTDSSSGNFDNPIKSLSAGIEIANSYNPTAENPVLIHLGIGEFECPNEIWSFESSHVYISGMGIELTKLISYRIIIAPETQTGFKNICLIGTLDIGDNFVSANNSKLLSLNKKSGEIVGTWFDFSGQTHTSDKSNLVVLNKFSEYKKQFYIFSNHFARIENRDFEFPQMAPPSPEDTNAFVLKSGDKMLGGLEVPKLDVNFADYSIRHNLINANTSTSWHYRIIPVTNTGRIASYIFYETPEYVSRILEIRGSWYASNPTGLDMLEHPVYRIPLIPSRADEATSRQYVDSQIATRIDYVTAGFGLSGGGTSGSITLDVNTGNGIEISGDAVTADGTLLRTNIAAETYLAKSDAENTYLAITNAQKKYLAISTASNTYFLKENLPIISGVYQFAGPINLNSNTLIYSQRKTPSETDSGILEEFLDTF